MITQRSPVDECARQFGAAGFYVIMAHSRGGSTSVCGFICEIRNYHLVVCFRNPRLNCLTENDSDDNFIFENIVKEYGLHKISIAASSDKMIKYILVF